MKKIIYRVRATGKISHDGDYDEYLRRCKTEQALVDNLTKFNEVNPTCFAEIVEIDEVAEFYRTRTLNAYKENLKDFEFMADKLDDLSRMIEDYIDKAKKAYKEEQEWKRF